MFKLQTSSTSRTPSASSSVSALSPMLSPSKSTQSVGSSGNKSTLLSYVSPSRSVSRASQMKSLSMSAGILVLSSVSDVEA